MHRWLIGLSAALLAPMAAPALAQDSVPQIPYNSVPNVLKMPKDMYLGEAAGVAVNSKGHIFVYSRSGSKSRPGLWKCGFAAPRIRTQRQVHPGDRPKSVCLVIRAHRAYRQGR